MSPPLPLDHPAMRAIGAALAVAELFGQTDGDHHKTWVIDQMCRMLNGVDYDDWVAAYESGGAKWNVGIAP